MNELSDSLLGKKNEYTDHYDPTLLFAIERNANRVKTGIDINNLPFVGVDIWNGFDFTWLNAHNTPEYGMLTIYIPCNSTNLIESKSLKLYLFSFANTKFDSWNEVVDVLEKDLSAKANSKVIAKLQPTLKDFCHIASSFTGENIDTITISCNEYHVNPNLLKCDFANIVTEELYSDLLRTNCLVTGKPDWGSVEISYTGPKIDRASLLQYIVSYRNHQGFHEPCLERIYMDILNICKPTYLTAIARYTRRGGLDINPMRSTIEQVWDNLRLFRQ